MVKRNNYGGLDRFRMFAAFLVIGIHTSPLRSYSEAGDFFLTRILGRIAVPFFFMVTGQFVLAEGLWNGKGGGRKILNYVKKTALLYGIAIVLYLPLGIYAGHYKGLDGPGLLRMLVFDGTFYHLWYFPACILGVLLIYLMSRVMDIRKMAVTAGILYVIGLFGDSYYGAVLKIPAFTSVYEAGFQIFSYTRNGLFLAPVFLVLGIMAGKGRCFGNKAVCLIGFAVSFAVMTGEAFLLRNLEFQRHDSMYFALIPVMVFLYQLLLAWKKKPLKSLRTVSAWVYILHPAMIVVVRGAAEVLKMEKLLVDNSLVHYLAVTVLSVAAAFGASYFFTVTKHIREKRENGNGKRRAKKTG